MDEINTDMECEFCQRIFMGNVEHLMKQAGIAILTPEKPLAKGHVLVVPVNHSSNPMVDPDEFGKAMTVAAMLAKSVPTQANFLAAAGQEANQGTFHTHVHLIPREAGDEIKMPWAEIE